MNDVLIITNGMGLCAIYKRLRRPKSVLPEFVFENPFERFVFQSSKGGQKFPQSPAHFPPNHTKNANVLSSNNHNRYFTANLNIFSTSFVRNRFIWKLDRKSQPLSKYRNQLQRRIKLLGNARELSPTLMYCVRSRWRVDLVTHAVAQQVQCFFGAKKKRIVCVQTLRFFAFHSTMQCWKWQSHKVVPRLMKSLERIRSVDCW